MKFFKPEDFEHPLWNNLDEKQREFVAKEANAKLEGHSLPVEGSRSMGEWHFKHLSCHVGKIITERALLIAIEPIEKCEHPREKLKVEYSIKYLPHRKDVVLCECGAELKLRSFDVCDD